MTSPDYPLLTLGGYETYQLAHIATFIADGLARHRLSRRGPAGRTERASALRDLTLGRTALDALRGATEPTHPHHLPHAIDEATYRSAVERIGTGHRQANVVAMPGRGEPSWAVVGQVPGIGRVGAVVDSAEIAHGLRSHFLSRPIEELASWAVIDLPEKAPALPERINVARAVEFLDPREPAHRAVAEALRGPDPYVDAAVQRQFPDLAAVGQDHRPSADVDGQQRSDDQGRPVRNQGAPVVDPDTDRRQQQERENGQQPGHQRVVPAQHEGDGREQLDVTPPQSAVREDRNQHGPERDSDGGQQWPSGSRGAEHRDQYGRGAQREGEGVGKSTLAGVHYGGRGTRNGQGQSNRGRPQPFRRRQARQPGQGRHGDHFGPAGAP